MATSKNSVRAPAVCSTSPLYPQSHATVHAPTAVPILPAGAHLFREGYRHPGLEMPEALPFIQETEEDTLYWVEPKEADPDSDDALHRSFDFGRRAAAAYFIFVSRNGPETIPLSRIVREMPEGEYGTGTAASQAFLHYLTRMLCFYGQTLSVTQIANDVGALSAEADALKLEDEEREVQAA